MGLFSSSERTTVGTSVARAIPDSDIVDRTPQSVIRALLAEESIVDHLLEGTINGMNFKVRDMLRYANDGYYYGTPNSKVLRSNDNEDAVKAAVEAETGRSISLVYLDLGPINASHVAWQQLIETHGYDRASNEIGSLSDSLGTTVWLKDFTVVYPQSTWDTADQGTLAAFGDPATHGYTPERPGQKNSSVGQYRQHTEVTIVAPVEGEPEPIRHIDVTYVYQGADELLEGSLTIPLTGYDLEADYFQALYSYWTGGTQKYAYWTYRNGAGVHPGLDALTDVDAKEAGVFFPFVVFRRNKTNLSHSSRSDTAEHQSATELMDRLGMSYSEIGSSIHDNPDIEDVEQAVLQFAIPATSQHPLDKQYLFAFFDNLYALKPSAEEQVMTWGNGYGRRTDISAGNALTLNDGGFRSTLSYGQITKRKRVRKIGTIGEVQNTTHTDSYQETYQSYEHVDRGEMGYVTRTRTAYTHYRIYRKQVTAQICEEIEVRNPQMRFSIWKDYDHVADYNDQALLIPLEQSLIDAIPYTDRDEFFQRAMHYVFNSRVTVKVKWYESTFFVNLLKIAAIAITIYSFGTQAHLIAAAAAVGTAALAWAIATVIVKMVVIRYGTELFVKEVGMEAAFAAAVIAAAVGAYSSFNATGGLEFMTAEGLVNVSSNIAADLGSGISSAVQSYTQDLIGGLQDDWADFQGDAESQMSLLETAQGLLETNGLIDPLMFTSQRPAVVFGETPDDFYQRTIHTGNIGTMVLDIPGAFVEQSLRLPDTHSSTQGGLYG